MPKTKPAKHPSKQEAQPTSTSDALIEPKYVRPKSLEVANGLTDEAMAKVRPGFNVEDVPKCLRPFLRTLDLTELQRAIREQPPVYWHPLVQAQVLHLSWLPGRLNYSDDSQRVARAAMEALNTLAVAHVTGLLHYPRPVEIKPRRAPGRRSSLKNKHPSHVPGSELLSASDVLHAWETIHEVLEPHRDQLLRKGYESPEKRVSRVANHLRGILARTFFEWSSRFKLDRDPPPSDLTESELIQWELAHLDAPMIWDVDLAEAVRDVISSDRHGKDGIAALLAYSLLGRLLDVDFATIRYKIEHAHSRRQQRE